MPVTTERGDTQQAQEPTTVWRWRFTSVAALRKALEEYTAFEDEQFRRGERDEGDPDPGKMDTTFRLMAQNKEIDRRMYRLEVKARLYHRLIDAYYRTGLCSEAMGWQRAARRVGLPSEIKISRGRDVSRPQFEVVLDMALTALWHTR